MHAVGVNKRSNWIHLRIERENGLDRYLHALEVKCLEHDFHQLLTVFLRVIGCLSQHDLVLSGVDLQPLSKCVVVPATLDSVLQRKRVPISHEHTPHGFALARELGGAFVCGIWWENQMKGVGERGFAQNIRQNRNEMVMGW